MKKAFNIGILTFLTCVVLFVGYSNIRDWSSLIVEYHFTDDARIFGLYPPDRVSKFYPLPGFQELAASPAYLDIRYWQDFKRVRVEIEYSKDPEIDFQIGYKVGKEFSWRLLNLPPPLTPPYEGGDKRGVNLDARNIQYAVLDVDLKEEYVGSNNVHRWIFSSSNVQDLGKAIRIYGVKFTFTK